MDQADTDVRVFCSEVGSEVLSAIDRTVLAAGAAEAYHQAGKTASAVGLDMRVHDTVDMFQKGEHFAIILKELDHWFITACQFLVWLISARIMD